MIIEEKVKDLVVVGEDTSKKAKISQDKLAKLQYLLTKGLYKDPITAVIAEWTNNGIDSVVQAGKNPIENPVLVTIQKDEKGQYQFKVEDKGVGLDDKDFEDICMNYLESTKESDNDTIGHFGIGMKSFLSLERSATFTCRKNGIERKYLVYEGAEFVNFDLIYQKETTEENGVIAELMINNWNEKNLFVDKAKAKLAYYDTAVLIIDGRPVENEIHRNELFQWSTLNQNDNLHICLKDVYYTIDWEALGIKAIRIPVALRLNLGDGLTPTPSRESYITNEKTKELLLKKIGELADWFVSKYNDTVKKFKTFMEAYEYLGELNFYVRMYDKEFLINPLLNYTKIKPANIKVEGITITDPNFYKMRRSDLLAEYSMVAYVNYMGVARSKAGRMGVSKERHILEDQGKTVLIGDDFRGNIRDFLKDKYGKETLFVKRNDFERKIGKSKVYGPNGQMKIEVDTYRHILSLATKKREVWRAHIEEWNFVVSSIVSTFKDERKVAESKEFADWLEVKREEQKRKRKLLGGTTYQGLGKQDGDVTLAYSYERYGKIHFKKEVFPIEDLTKNKYLTVLLTEDDNIELAKGIIQSIKDKDKIRFAMVGKKEIKKVPEHFQFINFQRFMTRDCKPFMRLASAIKFEELLQAYNQVSNYKNVVFKRILKTFNKDAGELKNYVDRNMLHPTYGLDQNLKNIIIDVADAHDLYDKVLWDRYLRVKEGVEKYDFITLFNVPSTTNAELTKRYERIIHQMLLFRKKFYNDLPEGAEIVFKEVKPETNEVV